MSLCFVYLFVSVLWSSCVVSMISCLTDEGPHSYWHQFVLHAPAYAHASRWAGRLSISLQPHVVGITWV